MSDAFSSEEAQEQDKDGYETLEEYIFQTERDHEKEIRKSIRLRNWQDMQLKIIKNKLGTNAVEVVARSYLMGLSRLREDHHDDIEKVSELLTEFLITIGKDARNEETLHKIGGKMDRIKLKETTELKDALQDPKSYSIRESAVSEVENNYVDDAFFGPWVHRYVATLGFLDSEMVTERTECKMSSFSSSVSNTMDEAGDEIESLVMDYISMSQGHWVENGMTRGMFESLGDVVAMMETDRKETCEMLLERSEDMVRENKDDE